MLLRVILLLGWFALYGAGDNCWVCCLGIFVLCLLLGFVGWMLMSMVICFCGLDCFCFMIDFDALVWWFGGDLFVFWFVCC